MIAECTVMTGGSFRFTLRISCGILNDKIIVQCTAEKKEESHEDMLHDFWEEVRG
jgi:hypothetical protein